MSAQPSSGSEQAPEEGDLRELPLPRLLLTLHRQGFDGLLVLSRHRNEKRFSFERGAPVLAESNLASETLGAQLVDKGVLDRSAYERVCRHMKDKGCREGVAMLALELIGPKDLFLALKDQVRRRMVDCFGWPDGRFRIEPGSSRGQDAQAFRCDPLALAQEGLEVHWTIERMAEGFASRLDRFVVPRDAFSKAVRRLKLSPEHAERIAALDGSRSLGAALGPAFSTPRTLAALWVLDALGALEYRDVAVETKSASGGFDLDVEIAIEPTAGSAAASASPDRAASAAAARAVPEAGDGHAALRSEIEKLRASLGEIDHYQILGIDPGAKPAAVKKAYFKAAKQYHPDTLARLGLEDLRHDASEVFARIAEAFEVLTDPDQRKDYDARLRGELTEADARRLARAETSYRKGEILLRMGDFVGALDYLRPAVEIWPDEPVYRSALGWALYKQPKSDPAAARPHLSEAVRLGPDDATAHMRLGMVLRAVGETAQAERMIATARSLQPDIA